MVSVVEVIATSTAASYLHRALGFTPFGFRPSRLPAQTVIRPGKTRTRVSGFVTDLAVGKACEGVHVFKCCRRGVVSVDVGGVWLVVGFGGVGLLTWLGVRSLLWFR